MKKYLLWIVIAIVIIFVIIGGAISSLDILKEETIKNHQQIAKIHNKIFEDEFQLRIENINFQTQNIQALMEVSSVDEVQKDMNEILKNSPYLRSINILEKGIVVLSTTKENKRMQLDTGNFFPNPLFSNSILRFGDPCSGRDLYEKNKISAENGKAIQNSFFPVSKKIVVQEIGYEVLFVINSDYFVNYFVQNIGTSFIDTEILSLNNRVYLSTDSSILAGEILSSNPLLEKAKETMGAVGTIIFKDKPTIISYRLTQKYPFVVTTRIDTNIALNNWRQRSADYLFVLMILVITSIVSVLLFIIRYVKAQEEDKRHHKEEKDIAQKANKTKSEFLANMSHEIRTPLNGIIGLTNMVLESPLEEKQKEYLKKANQSSLSLLHIIDDILDYSKIEVGKLEIVEEEFKLNEMIENICYLFRYIIQEKGLRFESFIDPDIDNVLIGDKLRLTQILNNFIGNAIKFTHDGFIKVEVEILEKNDEIMRLLFSVKDSGIGIAKENQDKLFHPFTQEDNSTTKKYGGTGLGLTISKQLIEMMGGEVFFESKKDLGSIFGFTLKLKYKKSVENRFVDINSKEIEEKEHDNSKLKEVKTALIVEDNTVNQIVANNILQKIGFKTQIANDGLEGLEAVKQNQFDIVFMDLQMPNMDGFEATRKIREFDTKIPIIALSAAVMSKDKELTKEAGMDDHLAKPIDKGRLFEVLQRYFELEEIKDEKKKEQQKSSQEIPTIKGIDLLSVVENFNGDIQSVLSLYIQFSKNYKDIEKIKYFDPDSKEYNEYLHKLKGVSGNLKLSEVFSLAKEIYELKKVELTGALIQKSKEVCKEIENKLVPLYERMNENRSPLSLDDLENIIQQLIKNIQGYEYIKRARIDELLNGLKERITKETIDTIDEQFEKGENEILIETLEELLKELRK